MIGMQITKELFFKQGSSSGEFASILAKAIETKQAINIKFLSNDLINIELCNASEEIVFHGSLKYDFQKTDVPNNIYLPFLVDISNIVVGYQFFYSYPNNYRSIASIFTKSIVTVFLSSKLVRFKKTSSKTSASNIGNELAKHLFWDYKKLIKSTVDASKMRNMEYTFFAHASLVSFDLLNIQFLDLQSKEMNKVIMNDYRSAAKKRQVRELLNYRKNILQLRYEV